MHRNFHLQTITRHGYRIPSNPNTTNKNILMTKFGCCYGCVCIFVYFLCNQAIFKQIHFESFGHKMQRQRPLETIMIHRSLPPFNFKYRSAWHSMTVCRIHMPLSQKCVVAFFFCSFLIFIFYLNRQRSPCLSIYLFCTFANSLAAFALSLPW